MHVNLLQNNDWSNVLSSDNPQDAFQLFSDCYRDVYDKCFPLRTIKCGYKTRKPWLSEGLKRSIKTKNKLFHWKQKTKRLEHETIYKKYRNKLNKLLLMAERKHYEQCLEENKCNLKGSWRVLNDIIHKKKDVSSCSRFLVNNIVTSDKQIVANGFFRFSLNTGVNLAKSIPSDPRSPTMFIKRNSQSMAIMPIIKNDVIDIIKNLKVSSPGWDSISAVVVKTTYPCFIEPLTHILNLSLMYGVFPSEMKLAKVIPLYKANYPMMFSNYWPVSVLPVFSKILERIMYNQLLSFINKHKLLYAYQFGFRINHAPELALLCLVDKVSDALENGEYVLGLFLDFFPKHSIPLITKFCSQNWNFWASAVFVCNGLEVIWATGNSMLCTMTHCLQSNGARVVFHRDLYLVRCYFCYTSMIWPMHQMSYIHSYLLMTLTCLLRVKIPMT